MPICMKCHEGKNVDEYSEGTIFEDTDEVLIWYCQPCTDKTINKNKEVNL